MVCCSYFLWRKFTLLHLTSSRGKTIWGSDSDKSALSTDFQLLRNNFSDVPIILGEYDASPTNTEPAARWKYVNQLVRSASKLNYALVLWDNGLDHLDRDSKTWRDPNSISMITKSISDTSNSLPDSTEETSVTTQSSSAYIFHQHGTTVKDQSLPFIFNGNTLSTITDSNGSKLTSGTDYSVSGSNIIFKASYLSKHFSDSTSPGVITSLALKFSGGDSSPIVQLVEWKTPILSSKTAVASAVSGSDLSIPITWGGLKTVAAVKAVTSSGQYLVDDFTQWFGPLQEGRAVSHLLVTWNIMD